MTKLMEWLSGSGAFAALWLYLLNSKYSDDSSNYVRHFVMFLPFYALLIFGVISVSIIAWRVYTFNDCEEAAKELQEQIKEAKADLKKRGLKIN